MMSRDKYLKITFFLMSAVFILSASNLIDKSTSYERVSDGEETGTFLKSNNTILSEIESIRNVASSIKSKQSKKVENTGSDLVVGTDNLKINQTLDEAGRINGSKSSIWWLNSGGRFYIQNGIGSTIKGDLPSTDKWFKEYSHSNPEDTDGGLHPQNIFRLVQRGDWQNFSQQLYFRVLKINESNSENRNASNGVLLFNRYQSGDSLYYAGLRVDGGLVVKKKFKGKYYTLAFSKVFDGVYNKDTNSSLIPLNSWIGIKTEIKNLTDGSVSIKVFLDKDNTKNWVLIIDAIDESGLSGSGIISSGGYAGIRSDFMDVEFKDYLIENI